MSGLFIPFGRVRERGATLDFGQALDAAGNRVSAQLAHAAALAANADVIAGPSGNRRQIGKLNGDYISIDDANAWRMTKAGVMTGVAIDGRKIFIADAPSALHKESRKMDALTLEKSGGVLIERVVLNRSEFMKGDVNIVPRRQVVDATALARSQETAQTISEFIGRALRRSPASRTLAEGGLVTEAIRQKLKFPIALSESEWYGGMGQPDHAVIEAMARNFDLAKGFFGELRSARSSALAKASNAPVYDVGGAAALVDRLDRSLDAAATELPDDEDLERAKTAARHLRAHLTHSNAMNVRRTQGERHRETGEMVTRAAEMDPSDPDGFRKALSAARRSPMRSGPPQY